MKRKSKIKCECDLDASNNPNPSSQYLPEEMAGYKHKPNECKGTYGLKQYKRGDKILWLCSCCCTLRDKELDG